MKKVLVGLSFFAPALVFAQDLGNIETVVEQFGEIVSMLIPIAFALAILFFFWGLAKYIFAAGNEAAQESGKRIMVWGVIALFIMASIWGIVAFLQNLIGIDEGNTQQIVPTVDGGDQSL